MRTSITSIARMTLGLAFVVLAAACDSGGTSAGTDDLRVSGVVTDDTASKSGSVAAKSGGSAGEVEDAAVTGSEVDDNGTVRPTGDETRTNERGEYLLESSASTDFMIVTATRGDFASRVLVDTRVQGTVRAASMTDETSAEADVFVESRRQGEATVTAADVAAYVTSEVATELRSGTETAARVAVAIGSAERARRTYASENGSVDDEKTRREEEEAYREYQASMSGHASASAAAAARTKLESRVAASLSAGGTHVRVRAEADETARAALVAFTANLEARVRFALRRQAELNAAASASAAVEAALRAESQARADAAAAAGARLRAAIRVGEGDAALAQAWAEFRSDIHGIVAAQLGIPTTTVSAAVTALATVDAALEIALQGSTTVDAIVDAKAEYYSQAESRLKTALGATAQADLGASILAVVEAR